MPDSLGPVIGLDLDNTLVGYDELLCDLAVSEGYLPPPAPPGSSLALGKRALRDALRAKGEHGEQEWRKLQALIYGAHMPRARLMPGVAEFLARVKALRADGARFSLYIVSHKTRLANNYSDGADFHQAAMDFLAAKGFFEPGTGLQPDQVFFEPTREAKVARIAALGCTRFVDDLEETFAEPGFPAGVARILFDPAGDAAMQPGVTRLRTWTEVADALLEGLAPAAAQDQGREQGPDFAALAGEGIASCQRIYGGRNSRVYRVETAGGRVFAGKHYHQHQDDPRDRLGAEWRALALLSADARLASFVARPVAKEPGQGLALYSFLSGVQASTTPATKGDMEACLEFLDALRGLSGSLGADAAQRIPPASEACFSLSALAANLRTRLDALLDVPRDACLGVELAQFLAEELIPLLDTSLTRAAQLGDPAQELPQHCRTLSPSDFGLHNALRTGGGLFFVDFEYFGWDDPAKTLCDFVLHPAMGLPDALRQHFADDFLSRFAGTDSGLPRRATTVYPLYAIKWCLILLNEFLRGADARRVFAAGAACGNDDAHARRETQLAKARAMLTQARTNHAPDCLR
ncbi:hypothetical protein [Humidesulfovibrio sp.]|uniref:hypothetical protein n=1 Tax=Humidesulfovibrio sp. TaxID=2910988 RepID=UPI002D7E9D25|nr:hypothetical protein [Humidesulfovibrio sp.]